MQGGTAEHVTVVAASSDLTRGWSYTALSRTRGATNLHIIDDRWGAERAEIAPAEPSAGTETILARVAERMRVRDDEDLAISQLPRPVDPERIAAAAEPVANTGDFMTRLR